MTHFGSCNAIISRNKETPLQPISRTSTSSSFLGEKVRKKMNGWMDDGPFAFPRSSAFFSNSSFCRRLVETREHPPCRTCNYNSFGFVGKKKYAITLGR